MLRGEGPSVQPPQHTTSRRPPAASMFPRLPRCGSITNSGLPVDAGSGTAAVSMATPEADAGMASAKVPPAQVSQDVPPKTQANGHAARRDGPQGHCAGRAAEVIGQRHRKHLVNVSWFNPSWQLSTTQPLAHSPPVGWGRESEE